MAEFAALPLFTDAFLADTSHLDAAETGAYLMLLMAAWRSPLCAIPNDDARLARMARCDGRTWKRIKPAVMAFWTVGDDGLLRQKRLSKERDYCNASRANKVRAAEAARDAKSLKSHRAHGAEQSADNPLINLQPTPTPTFEEARASSRETRAVRAPPPDWPRDYRERFWAEYPHKVGRPKALAKLDAIAKRGAVRWGDLIGGLRRYVAEKPADRPWCNPETWLNQERWADQPASVQPSSRPPPGPPAQRRNPFFALAEELLDDQQFPDADDLFPEPAGSRRGADLEGVRSSGVVDGRPDEAFDLIPPRIERR